MTTDLSAVLDTPATTGTLDADFERERSALVSEEARDMVIRFLDIVMSGDRAAIERRLDNPSAIGTIVDTMASEGWSVDETADALIEVHRATAHLAHQAFLRATADGYDYETLVLGVHDTDAPWIWAVESNDLTVAVAATTTGHLDDADLLRSGTLDGLLVCAAHALSAATFTEGFGWLDFAADVVNAPSTSQG